ncbi:hypothetical protein R6Q57_013136 [Mikania cordata]
MDVELHDWEVLADSISVQNTGYLDGIERDSDGIRSDHFSIDSHDHESSHVEGVIDQVSVDTDNPSCIDPVCDTTYPTTKPIGVFSSTDGSDDGRYADTEASNNELGVVHESLSDSGQTEIKSSVCEIVDEELEPSGEEKIVEARQQGSNDDVLARIVKSDGEERNSVAVWWKLPFDLLKYCMFKASPVWTLSAVAAMMGVVILGRRLYKLRQKTRTLQLKVAVDDKKISQVMSQAARLNEAFSVVKQAPIIRPSLPASGIAPWPMMALR